MGVGRKSGRDPKGMNAVRAEKTRDKERRGKKAAKKATAAAKPKPVENPAEGSAK